MPHRVYDDEPAVHFLTFGCDRRRKLLSLDRPKRIVIGHLGKYLGEFEGHCGGFVIMPDHVHAMIWFAETGRVSDFVKEWKCRSSADISDFLRRTSAAYVATFDGGIVWQNGFHDFNIVTRLKYEEKLTYMHLNPVRAGLAEKAVDWRWSSAGWYAGGRSCGVPISVPSGL